MQETWQAYVELLTGVTEATRRRARDVAGRLVESGVATAAQLQVLTEELVASGDANRDALRRTVQAEVDRGLDRVGLVRAEQFAALADRVAALEAALGAGKASAAPRRAAKKAAAPAGGRTASGGVGGERSQGAGAPPRKVAKKAAGKGAA